MMNSAANRKGAQRPCMSYLRSLNVRRTVASVTHKIRGTRPMQVTIREMAGQNGLCVI